MATYTVSPVDPRQERQSIFEVWRRNLSSTDKLDEKFDWHFLRNPYGPARCWLLRTDTGAAVGTAALGPRPLKIGTSVVTAGVACDLAVDKEHRFLQPALLLQRAVVGAVGPDLPVIYGLPNPQGAAAPKRVGYREVDSVARYAKPLRLSPYLRRHRLLAGAAPVLGGALDFVYGLAARFRERRPQGAVAEAVPEFDERFDELWGRSKSAHEVIGVRDRRHLTWRYRECPLQSYTTTALLTRDRSQVLGYIVSYLQDDRAFCADILADEGADAEALIAAWVRDARDRAANTVSVLCRLPPALQAALDRVGFRSRTATPAPRPTHGPQPEPSRTLLVYAAPGYEAVAQTPWYFTPGDEPYN
jgi:hypothetical protein